MPAPVVTALLSSASVLVRLQPQALVLACMDARLHVEKVLGIANGGPAHVQQHCRVGAWRLGSRGRPLSPNRRRGWACVLQSGQALHRLHVLDYRGMNIVPATCPRRLPLCAQRGRARLRRRAALHRHQPAPAGHAGGCGVGQGR